MTKEELANIFEENLLPTNRGFNYYIDWKNIILDSTLSIEYSVLDSLINVQSDFDTKFCEILSKVPTVILTFPTLFALGKVDRKNLFHGEKLRIIGSSIDSNDYQEFDFSVQKAKEKLTDNEIKIYLSFFIQMGLKDLYQNRIKKSTEDYITGVLVGLDSNGRKNRGGEAFELACEPLIRSIASKYGLTVLTQKMFKSLREKGLKISSDIENRKADFIIYRNTDMKCLNVEVNFYNGGGSKPEEIIDSYINRQDDLKASGIEFGLITDGNCWRGTTSQLSKGFRHLNNLMNYQMAKKSCFEKMINDIF